MTSPRWRNRPDGSNWGEFGPDDECGRLNLLTPAKVLQGIAEVREGRRGSAFDRTGGTRRSVYAPVVMPSRPPVPVVTLYPALPVDETPT